MNKKMMMVAAVIAAALIVGGTVGYLLLKDDEPQTLKLATTTSTYDSGLLDYILPIFEEEHDCTVDVIAVGSGAAITLGQNGDVDVLLVHSPAAEIAFVEAGYGESRSLVMYNNFVIVGPTADPIDTMSSANASQAFQRIYDNGTAGNATFISRADASGTYTKELSIWATLGYNKTEVMAFPDSWYIQSGQGMGAVLDMAEEMDAYTLSDDATYYQRVSEDLIPNLNMTYSGDSALFNQYSVIPVNATMWTHVNHTLALEFKNWLVSDDGQDLIASYERYDMQLFFPNAEGYTPSTESLLSIQTFDAVCATVPAVRTGR
jgi:tungstate transport system substrate-binding protein